MSKKKTSTPVKGTVTVKQTGSPIRRNAVQKLYLKSLGLGRIGRIRELEDNNIVRGLIKKAAHMIEIVEN
jgi:large subunit ribosomal protein L30